MKNLICISSPGVLQIQETKLEEHEFLKASNFLWKKGEGVVVCARDASRGLGTLWNPSKLKLIQTTTCTHWILTYFLKYCSTAEDAFIGFSSRSSSHRKRHIPIQRGYGISCPHSSSGTSRIKRSIVNLSILYSKDQHQQIQRVHPSTN